MCTGCSLLFPKMRLNHTSETSGLSDCFNLGCRIQQRQQTKRSSKLSQGLVCAFAGCLSLTTPAAVLFAKHCSNHIAMFIMRQSLRVAKVCRALPGYKVTRTLPPEKLHLGSIYTLQDAPPSWQTSTPNPPTLTWQLVNTPKHAGT